MKSWLRTWQTYIGQAADAEVHRERIERLITYSAEQEDGVLSSLGKDKFFFQAWIKYAENVSDTEDVLDFMLDKQIGVDFASAYIKVAEYAEHRVRDLRKADAILRRGLSHLGAKEQLGKELARLEADYSKFGRRINSDHTQAVRNVLRRQITYRDHYIENGTSRRYDDQRAVKKNNEKVLDRLPSEPQTFTENQKFIGGVPIYVDADVRDQVIPKGKQQVEKLFTELGRLYKHEPAESENFYVSEVQRVRQEEQRN